MGMNKAIGMAEFVTVSQGVAATDRMIKTAGIDVLEAQTVCPGKYMVIIGGELSAVIAAIEAARTFHAEKMIDSFVLGNPHESIFPAIYSTAKAEEVGALGVMETFSVVSAIVAADTAAKTALVELIELRLARGMCGKSYLMLTGSVASVSAAIERAKEAASDHGMFLDSTVIPNPDKKLWDTIL